MTERTIADRARRAQAIVETIDIDAPIIGLHFGHAALEAAVDAETADETIVILREARRCLGAVDPDCPEATRQLREARQVATIPEVPA